MPAGFSKVHTIAVSSVNSTSVVTYTTSQNDTFGFWYAVMESGSTAFGNPIYVEKVIFISLLN